jgi:competence protein ComEC
MRNSTKILLPSLILAVIFIWAVVLSRPDGRLHVIFLDVGQGDAIFIVTPTGRQVLIDGGPSPGQLASQLARQLPFWDRSLDLIVNTHPDADHLAGLVELVARYRVDTVLSSGLKAETALYEAWREQLQAEGLEPLTANDDMVLRLDHQVSADVLHPNPALAPIDGANNHSVSLRLHMGQISFLLAGDIEVEVERYLVGQGFPLQSTVLKSPHHGSSTSSSMAFLEAVDPQLVVISVGADNRFGHPAQPVLERYAERGAPVLRTDELGTIEFITDGHRLWLETGR